MTSGFISKSPSGLPTILLLTLAAALTAAVYFYFQRDGNKSDIVLKETKLIKGTPDTTVVQRSNHKTILLRSDRRQSTDTSTHDSYYTFVKDSAYTLSLHIDAFPDPDSIALNYELILYEKTIRITDTLEHYILEKAENNFNMDSFLYGISGGVIIALIIYFIIY